MRLFRAAVVAALLTATQKAFLVSAQVVYPDINTYIEFKCIPNSLPYEECVQKYLAYCRSPSGEAIDYDDALYAPRNAHCISEVCRPPLGCVTGNECECYGRKCISFTGPTSQPSVRPTRMPTRAPVTAQPTTTPSTSPTEACPAATHGKEMIMPFLAPSPGDIGTQSGLLCPSKSSLCRVNDGGTLKDFFSEPDLNGLVLGQKITCYVNIGGSSYADAMIEVAAQGLDTAVAPGDGKINSISLRATGDYTFTMVAIEADGSVLPNMTQDYFNIYYWLMDSGLGSSNVGTFAAPNVFNIAKAYFCMEPMNHGCRPAKQPPGAIHLPPYATTAYPTLAPSSFPSSAPTDEPTVKQCPYVSYHEKKEGISAGDYNCAAMGATTYFCEGLVPAHAVTGTGFSSLGISFPNGIFALGTQLAPNTTTIVTCTVKGFGYDDPQTAVVERTPITISFAVTDRVVDPDGGLKCVMLQMIGERPIPMMIDGVFTGSGNTGALYRYDGDTLTHNDYDLWGGEEGTFCGPGTSPGLDIERMYMCVKPCFDDNYGVSVPTIEPFTPERYPTEAPVSESVSVAPAPNGCPELVGGFVHHDIALNANITSDSLDTTQAFNYISEGRGGMKDAPDCPLVYGGYSLRCVGTEVDNTKVNYGIEFLGSDGVRNCNAAGCVTHVKCELMGCDGRSTGTSAMTVQVDVKTVIPYTTYEFDLLNDDFVITLIVMKSGNQGSRFVEFPICKAGTDTIGCDNTDGLDVVGSTTYHGGRNHLIASTPTYINNKKQQANQDISHINMCVAPKCAICPQYDGANILPPRSGGTGNYCGTGSEFPAWPFCDTPVSQHYA